MTGTKQTGRAVSMPRGLLTGLMYAFLVILIGCLITAKLIDTEIIHQNQIGYAVMVILLTAAWTDGTVSYHRIKRQKLLVSILSGTCLYCLLLSITAVIFGGQYDGAGETALLILCGSLLSVILKPNRKTGRKVRKLKIQNR